MIIPQPPQPITSCSPAAHIEPPNLARLNETEIDTANSRLVYVPMAGGQIKQEKATADVFRYIMTGSQRWSKGKRKAPLTSAGAFRRFVLCFNAAKQVIRIDSYMDNDVEQMKRKDNLRHVKVDVDPETGKLDITDYPAGIRANTFESLLRAIRGHKEEVDEGTTFGHYVVDSIQGNTLLLLPASAE